MRIKLRTIYAGPLGSGHPGDVLDVSDAQGEELIKRGFAEPLQASRASRPRETAVMRGGEKAVTK